MTKKIVLVLVTLLAISGTPAIAFQEGKTKGKAEKEHYRFSKPDQVTWGTAPAALSSGAQLAVLEGDPTNLGSYTMRLKMPDGYQIKPHTHPRREHITVISGMFMVGMGGTWDDSKLTDLPSGTYAFVEPGNQHFAKATGETVIQLNGEGPWQINYVNPADDPRKTKSK
jgi:quercetin dioxygenase-like cupin family protein